MITRQLFSYQSFQLLAQGQALSSDRNSLRNKAMATSIRILLTMKTNPYEGLKFCRSI